MNYLIIFDQEIIGTYSPADIHGVFTKIPGSTNWWHYISNTYIVTTNQTSAIISDHIYKILPLLKFLVVKIVLDDSNGVLQKDAWEWINKNKTSALALRAILGNNPLPKPSSSLPTIPSLKPYFSPSSSSLPPIRTLRDIFDNLKR